MIRRAVRRRTWTTLDNALIEDEALDFAALGALVYILSKPDDWQIRLADMRRRGGIGRTALGAIMETLRRAGYAELVRVQGEGNRLAGTTWTVCEERQTAGDADGRDSRQSGFPTVGEPDSIVKTEVLPRTEKTVKTEKARTAGAQPAKDETAGRDDMPGKVTAPRSHSPWADFRATILGDYGQAPTGANQALATRVVSTAVHHELRPDQAARAWRSWREDIRARDVARFWPFHRAAEGWGEWLQEKRRAAPTMPPPTVEHEER